MHQIASSQTKLLEATSTWNLLWKPRRSLPLSWFFYKCRSLRPSTMWLRGKKAVLGLEAQWEITGDWIRYPEVHLLSARECSSSSDDHQQQVSDWHETTFFRSRVGSWHISGFYVWSYSFSDNDKHTPFLLQLQLWSSTRTRSVLMLCVWPLSPAQLTFL